MPAGDRSRLPEVVEERMLAQPDQWEGYYTGTAQEQALARRYSYSDRMRYYWPDPEIEAAVATLLENLTNRGIPDPLLSAFLPDQYERVRSGRSLARPGSSWSTVSATYCAPTPRPSPPLTRRSGPCPWSSSG